ncbi:MAG: hypothetical protein HUU01_07380 [Saprospiraceae bacterium]|nr:hypothetical protein [Saprospiraceae bacterium]
MALEKTFLDWYNKLLQTKDPEEAWRYFDLDFSECTEEEKLNADMAMFKETWHNLHDSLAMGFQIDKNPAAVKFLFESVMSGNIPEFDYKPVSRKCIWALADIGTVEAKACLEQIARSGDEIIAGFAKKRLDNWAKEVGRKGNHNHQ